MPTRYGLSLKLDCDNDAFAEDRAAEIARVLRRTAERIEKGQGEHCALINSGLPSNGWLFDHNGNSCGWWDIKPRRIRD